MGVFSAPDFDRHESVMFCHDPKTGLKALIAIHNTYRGPSLGGCRFWAYENEDLALKDALRLSRGMTYKAAMAHLALGGGKGVIIGDSRTQKTPEIMRAFGQFVNRLGGLYITAEDVGTTPKDMEFIRQSTPHVVGMENGSGDPSILTAYGVYQGIKASAQHKWGHDDLKGVKIAVQGLGSVGMNLLKHLSDEGADLIVTDLDPHTATRAGELFGAQVKAPEGFLKTPCDILSPCALGGGFNDETIETLQCQIIAGAANNQLALPHHGTALRHQGILYAPDYVVNAGGLINVTYEGKVYDRNQVFEHVGGIYQTLLEVFQLAHQENLSTNEASDRIAETRFQMAQEAA